MDMKCFLLVVLDCEILLSFASEEAILFVFYQRFTCQPRSQILLQRLSNVGC